MGRLVNLSIQHEVLWKEEVDGYMGALETR